MAVSDDGQWIAAASSAGVYQWGTDGVPRQLYGGSDAAALAFFAGSSDAGNGNFDSASRRSRDREPRCCIKVRFAPAGLATSFDNQEIVLADKSGSTYSVNAATHAVSTINCECRPNGVFGLGGALFRLTSSSIGAIKLFDAAAGADPGGSRR